MSFTEIEPIFEELSPRFCHISANLQIWHFSGFVHGTGFLELKSAEWRDFPGRWTNSTESADKLTRNVEILELAENFPCKHLRQAWTTGKLSVT